MNSGVFPEENKHDSCTLNFCSGTPLRKVHELTFLWFGLPGPLLILIDVSFDILIDFAVVSDIRGAVVPSFGCAVLASLHSLLLVLIFLLS